MVHTFFYRWIWMDLLPSTALQRRKLLILLWPLEHGGRLTRTAQDIMEWRPVYLTWGTFSRRIDTRYAIFNIDFLVKIHLHIRACSDSGTDSTYLSSSRTLNLYDSCATSQGAAAAALLSALVSLTSHSLNFCLTSTPWQLERPQVHPEFLINGKPPHPPL